MIVNSSESSNDLKPLHLSPKAKENVRSILFQSLAETHGEHWAALQSMSSKEDVAAANARISKLQGPSPRDNAWLTPIDPEPPQVPGWDRSNRVNLAVAKQVYDEYVAAGKIPRLEDTATPDCEV